MLAMNQNDNRSIIRFSYYAFILVIAGFFFGIAYVGVDIISFYTKYIQILYLSIVPIIIGIIAIFSAILSLVMATFGFIGIQKLSNQVITLYAVALGISMFVNICLTATCFGVHKNQKSTYEQSMSLSLVLYDEVFFNSYKNVWDRIQNTYDCCGVNSWKDWDIVFGSDRLPQSCCSSNYGNCSPSSGYVKYNSCLDPLVDDIDSRIHTIAIVSLVFILIHIPGLAIAYFAGKLARKNVF